MSIRKRMVQGRPRWDARWEADGRWHSRTFDRREDAEAHERRIRDQLRLGAFAQVEPSRQVLDDWLAEWWTRYAVAFAPRTRRQRRGVIEKWIVPYIGRVRLADLGPGRVGDWRAEILAAGCPPIQANKALKALSAALGRAVRERRLPFNPCSLVDPLPELTARPKALTPSEVEGIRAALPTLRDRVLVSVMGYAGLRPSEALALGPQHLLGGVLLVERQVEEDGSLGVPKSGRARTVELIAPLIEDLERLRRAPAEKGPLLFWSRGSRRPEGGPLELHNWRNRVWRPACADAGVVAVPYDLRHTFASLRLHEGRSLPWLSVQMGHGSAKVTLDRYAHLYESARLAPSTPMDEAVRSARRQLAAIEGCHEAAIDGPDASVDAIRMP